MNNNITWKISAILGVFVLVTSCMAPCIAIDRRSANNASSNYSTYENNATKSVIPLLSPLPSSSSHAKQYHSNDTMRHAHTSMPFEHDMPPNESEFFDPLARDEYINRTRHLVGHSLEEDRNHSSLPTENASLQTHEKSLSKKASRSVVKLSSNTIYVPDDYANIQWAVDNASTGDTIIVREGKYTENIDVITPHLTIISENGADITKITGTNHTLSSSVDEVVTSGYYDIGGHWDGTTNQNKTVRFNVFVYGPGVTDFYIEGKTSDGSEFTVYITGLFPIKDYNFTISSTAYDVCKIVGTFTSQNEAQGTWHYMSGSTGCSGTGTWTAEKSAPTACFSVSPSSGCLDTLFSFDASCSSDAQDSTSDLKVKWDWENDGVYDTSYTTTKTASHQYTSTGSKTIKLQVKDTDGRTDTITESVVVTKQIYVDDDFVDDPAKHKWSTIQEGINDSISGDTIIVYNGLYNENVVVRFLDIKLRGEDRDNTIIDGGGSGDVVKVIYADDCEISGFTVRNSGTYYAGIKLYCSHHNNVVTNNILSHNRHGIRLDDSNGNTLTNNILSHNSNGIVLDNSNSNTLTNNTVNSNNFCGITLHISSDNLIYNNYFNNTNNTNTANDGTNNIWNTTKMAGTNIIGGSYLGGNYWSDYAGKDLDGDDLGDTPYDIGTNKDYLPLTKSTITFTANCPVDLSATDPDGFTITKSSNEILGATYTETDINGDGDLDDQIIIPSRKIGDYQITVIPEPDAEPTDTYTLKITLGDTTIILAEDNPISDTPDQPYVVESTEEGIIIACDISLTTGWNLISAPLNLTTWELGEESVVGTPLNVTPKNSLTSIYRYDTTSDSFEKCDYFDDWGRAPATGSESFTELEPGRGYWVSAKTDCNLTFTGTAPSDRNVTLDTDWNIIGWYSAVGAILGEEAIVGNPLNVTPKNSLTSIYKYNVSTEQFDKCDYFDDWGWAPATGSEGFTELEPGRGYWVQAKNNCVWGHRL